MIMIVLFLRTKPSSLYRHRRGLGLHQVGYREGNLHIRIAKLAFHAQERNAREARGAQEAAEKARADARVEEAVQAEARATATTGGLATRAWAEAVTKGVLD